jgi:hypothetical protein
MRITVLFVSAFIVLPIGAQSVIVQPPLVKAVSLPWVHTACGDGADFDACTQFVAYRLNASCDGSKIHASVTFRPLIFVYNFQQMTHEWAHIDDVRTYCAGYVNDLEQRRFETESECRDAATLASATFGERMREFAGRSMARIH